MHEFSTRIRGRCIPRRKHSRPSKCRGCRPRTATPTRPHHCDTSRIYLRLTQGSARCASTRERVPAALDAESGSVPTDVVDRGGFPADDGRPSVRGAAPVDANEWGR